MRTEVEFSDINLTEDSSLFLHQFTVPTTGVFLWEDSSLCPEILPKNAVKEFHLRT
jgi:hypothetical protein